MTADRPVVERRLAIVFVAAGAVSLLLDWPALLATRAIRAFLGEHHPASLLLLDRWAAHFTEWANANFVVPALLVAWLAAELASLAGNRPGMPLSLAFWDIRPLRHGMLFMTFSLLLTTALIWVPKVVLGRARPKVAEWVYDFRPFTLEADFYSLPSGHTQFVATVVFVAAAIWPRLFVPAVAIAVLMGLTRVFQGRHYLGDAVVSGLICWVAVQWVAARWYRRRRP